MIMSGNKTNGAKTDQTQLDSTRRVVRVLLFALTRLTIISWTDIQGKSQDKLCVRN